MDSKDTSFYFSLFISSNDLKRFLSLSHLHFKFHNKIYFKNYFQRKYGILVEHHELSSYIKLMDNFEKLKKIKDIEKLNNEFRSACKRGYIERIKLLLEQPNVDPTANNNYAI